MTLSTLALHLRILIGTVLYKSSNTLHHAISSVYENPKYVVDHTNEKCSKVGDGYLETPVRRG